LGKPGYFHKIGKKVKAACLLKRFRRAGGGGRRRWPPEPGVNHGDIEKRGGIEGGKGKGAPRPRGD